MKKLYKGFLMAVLLIGFLYQSATATERDTVTINLGNNSKVVIQFKDKDELKRITQYDINQMLKDLSISVDSTEDAANLKIEDETGTRYLSDTTISSEIRENEEFDEYEEDKGEWNDKEGDDDIDVSIRLGGFEFHVEGDKDEIEREVEDWDDGDLRIKKDEYEEERRGKNSNHFYVDFGMNNYLQKGKFPSSNAAYAVKPWGSWYVALNSVHRSAISGPLFLEWGAGVSWYNFKLENQEFQISEGIDMTEYIEPADLKGIKSKLTSSYFNLSFVPVLDFGRGKKKVRTYGSGSFKISQRKQLGFRVGAGIYGGYRIGSHSKFISKNTESGRDTDKDRDSFFLQNWRYGVRAQLGFKGTDLFVNYDLNELFEDGQNPKLNAISFGLIL